MIVLVVGDVLSEWGGGGGRVANASERREGRRGVDERREWPERVRRGARAEGDVCVCVDCERVGGWVESTVKVIPGSTVAAHLHSLC